MRIVWASVAFVAGVASALVFGFAPGHNIPVVAFGLLSAAAALAATALILSRRRAAYALLCLVFLLGCWRGGDVPIDDVQFVGQSDVDRPLGQARSFVEDRLLGSLSESKAGLPMALLTGNRSLLSIQTTNDFRNAGMAHLLAISGLHVSLVGGFAMALLALMFGRRRAIYLLVPVCLVLLYAVIAGFAPPVTRAAIMFSVFILGRFMGRGSHTLAALAFAATAMVAWEPKLITSLSFQLSFAAMLGISFVAPVLDEFVEVARVNRAQNLPSATLSRLRRFVAGSLIVSIAATVATFPLVAWHFQAVPFWGPIATLVATPSMPVLIFSTAFLAAVGSLPVISAIASIPVQVATQYLDTCANLFANLPPGPVTFYNWPAWTPTIAYAAIATVIIGWPHVKRVASRLVRSQPVEDLGRAFNQSSTQIVVISASVMLLVCGFAMWAMWLMRDDTAPRLTVTFLQTSHGESIFIRTPNDNRMLIDGGGDANEVADALGSLLPLWDREIDIVMLTHPDADHVGGLPAVLNRFHVETVIDSGLQASSDAFESWSNAIETHNNVVIARPGTTIGLDHDVFLEVIAAGCLDGSIACDDANEASIVARLSHGDISFLLTGDIERTAEIRLANSANNLRSTVFKAPHHGSATSSTSSFIEAVDPAAVIVAAGTENRYGHPNGDVIDRLNSAVGEDRVFRTDLSGTVVFSTDGTRLWTVRQN